MFGQLGEMAGLMKRMSEMQSKMKKIKKRTLLTPNDKTGLLFVLPFIIGFIFLFFKPLLESLNYTLHSV